MASDKPKALCVHQRLAKPDGQVTYAAGSPGPCEVCKAESHKALIYRLKLIAGLLMPFALQALDVTIIASAVSAIANDFNEINELNWIVASFNLTSAAFIPFWGQMADIFGRHTSLQAVLVLMTLGSTLCTAAPTSSYTVLLLGRGFQGAACAGISVLVRTIISDKVSLQENAKNWSFFAATGGCSYAIGPVVGGYLTSANWRWCFGINLPICVLGIIIVFCVLRKELVGPQPLPGVDADDETTTTAATETGPKNTGPTVLRRLMTIDIGGQILFLFGFGLIILAFTWAGDTYAWNSPQVLVPLALGVVIVASWVGYEYLMSPGRALGKRFSSQRPMIPFQFLKNRNIGLLFYINFSTGAAIYSVLYYVDLYYTLILGYSSSKAGTQLLYYVPGISVGVYSAVLFSNVWPRGTFLPLFLGSVIEAVGVEMIAWAMSTGHVASIYGMVAFSGVGTGLRFMPGTLHAVGFFPNDIASIVSLMGIATPFGGAVALTVMSTVYNNLAATDAKSAFVWAFVAMCPLMGICIVCAACLGNVSIVKPEAGNEGQGEEARHVATNESYLLALLRGSKTQAAGDAVGMQERGEAGAKQERRLRRRREHTRCRSRPLEAHLEKTPQRLEALYQTVN